MKKYLLFLFGILLLHLQSRAQNVFATGECNMLDTLKFKNSIAKIQFRATTNEVGRVSDREILKKLEKAGKLKAKDFGYAIAFRPLGCTRTYYISSGDGGEDAQRLFKLGGIETNVRLFCTVYEKFKMWDYPFFVIDKVQIE